MYAEQEAAEIRRVLGGSGHVDAVVSARGRGIPLEQALGRAQYLGVEVAVTEDVFVPRRRTERLVQAACAQSVHAQVAVDLGCGSGAIAAALSRLLPEAEVHACDIDSVAVGCARDNGATYGFAVHQGEWWEALPERLRGRVDLAIGYLPHVPTSQMHLVPRDFRDHEPRAALDGGPDGLQPFHQVAVGAGQWLSPNGSWWTLLADEQADQARVLAGQQNLVVHLQSFGDDALVRLSRSR